MQLGTSHLIALYVPLYCDPLSDIIATEGHFEIMLPLNMHGVYHTKLHRISMYETITVFRGTV